MDTTKTQFESAEEFARRIGVAVDTVRTMVRDGRLASLKTSEGRGGKILVPIAEADRLLKQAYSAQRSSNETRLQPEGQGVDYCDEYNGFRGSGASAKLFDDDAPYPPEGDDGFPLVAKALADWHTRKKAEQAEAQRKHAEHCRKIAQDNLDREAREAQARMDREAKLALLREHPELLDTIHFQFATQDGES